MFAAELTYRSWVALHGYRWVRYRDLHDPKGQADYLNRVLTETGTGTGGAIPRRYRPCEPFDKHPALYREFAAIPWGDADAILTFANRFGILDSDPEMGQHADELPPGVFIRNRQNFIPADREENWTEGPAKFRALIRAWESPPEQLAKMFEWRNLDWGYNWVFTPAPEDGPRKRDPRRPGLLDVIVYRQWETPETNPDEEPAKRTPAPSRRWDGMEPLEEVAAAFIRQEVAKGLQRGGCRLRFATGADGEDVFQVAPDNLLVALFVQFGRAFAGDKQHRRCPVCGTWFELVPQDKGRKEFCSPACKVKDYRNRVKAAADLHGQGRTPEQIAEATHTDLDTIRKWLGVKNNPKKKGRK